MQSTRAVMVLSRCGSSMPVDPPAPRLRVAAAIRAVPTLSRVNLVLRLILAVWVLGYLFVSCAPLLQGDLGGGLLGLLVGGVFFVPWLVGVVVLGLLVTITNPRPGPRS